MIKSLIKKFLPSDQKLALQAAKKIQSEGNAAIGDNTSVVARYATLANGCAQIAAELTEMLKDGSISDLETTELADIITPLITKARALAGL